MTAYVKNASVPPHLVDSRDPLQSRRRVLFTLVGSAAAETCAFDVDLPAEAVECVAQSCSPVDGKRGRSARIGRAIAPIDRQAQVAAGFLTVVMEPTFERS